MTADCRWTDVYGYEFACTNVPADPCIADPLGGSTLWHAQPCDGNDKPTFCATFPDHPVCAATVEVGPPPTLPDTGMPVTTGLGLVALTLMFLGVVLYGWRPNRTEGGTA